MLISIKNRTQGALCKSKQGKEIFQKKRTCHDIAQTLHLHSSQDYYSLKYRASKCFDATKIPGRVLQAPNRNLPLPPQLPISSHLLEGWTEGRYLGCHEDCKKEALETITTPARRCRNTYLCRTPFLTPLFSNSSHTSLGWKRKQLPLFPAKRVQEQKGSISDMQNGDPASPFLPLPCQSQTHAKDDH